MVQDEIFYQIGLGWILIVIRIGMTPEWDLCNVGALATGSINWKAGSVWEWCMKQIFFISCNRGRKLLVAFDLMTKWPA